MKNVIEKIVCFIIGHDWHPVVNDSDGLYAGYLRCSNCLKKKYTDSRIKL